jgi:glycosyltransferase involved in cell wall biosynthesis
MYNSDPLISIGIPTYNRVDLLDEAISCAVNQTYKNLEIIISDNASPGNEVEVLVKSYMDNDKRILFKKQSMNMGPGENFKYVLSKAKGDYFLLAADDDVRSLDFVEKNLEFLRANPDFIASTSPTRFKDGEFDSKKIGVNSLEGNVEERMLLFFSTWHANGRFSSLIRMSVMYKAYDSDLFLGNDWMVISKLLLKGKFNLIDEGWAVLGKGGMSHNNVFRSFRSKSIEFIFPFWVLTIFLFKLMNSASLKFKVKLLFKMTKLNFSAFKLNLSEFTLNSKTKIYSLYK